MRYNYFFICFYKTLFAVRTYKKWKNGILICPKAHISQKIRRIKGSNYILYQVKLTEMRSWGI